MKIIVQPELMLRLRNKIQSDLKFGVKIKGDEINRADRIRLWNKAEDGVAFFGIVATSTVRFGNAGNTIEIQRFDNSGSMKLSLLFLELEDHSQMEEISITKTDKSYWEKTDASQQEFSDFINQYFHSLPDADLTKTKIEAEFHNSKDIEWV